MECNVIVYNISENATKQQVEEATWVITGERVSRLTAPWTLRCTPISFFYITLVFFSSSTTALHAEMENFKSRKMFILVSTVLTWAMTKPQNPVSL